MNTHSSPTAPSCSSSGDVIRALRCWGGIALITGLVAVARAEVVVVINEVDTDQPGPDGAEFVELYASDAQTGQAVPAFALDPYVVVFFNGSSPTDSAYAVTPVGGVAAAAVRLTGLATNEAGMFVIGSSGLAGSGIELLTGASGWLQNGADAVALYRNPTTEFTTATGATAADLVDAIVYGTDDPEEASLVSVLTPGQFQVNEAPNGNTALARLPDGGEPFATGTFQQQAPTPGFPNHPVNTLTLIPAASTVGEGARTTATLTRTGSTARPVVVALGTSDPSEITTVATVEIPGGSSSVAVDIHGVDDLWPDGSQSVVLSAAAPGYARAEVTLTINDNDIADQPLVINEVYATGRGDANGDGLTGTGGPAAVNDEFVEIVNRSGEAVDLSGYTLFEAFQPPPRHTFPAGTVLNPGCALVVFGGGVPASNGTAALGTTAAFGNAWIQSAQATPHGLFLVEPADRLSLRNRDGLEVAGMAYEGQTDAFDSMTRDADVTGPFQGHATTPSGLPYSPGTMIDGTPFCTITAALAVSIAPAHIAENAGGGAATLTVSRPPPFDRAVLVTVISGDPGEAGPATASVTIPAGQPAATVPLAAVDDAAPDGTQAVTFTCVGAGHLNGAASLDVTDDGDVPPGGVFINELDADQSGADTGEFIELSIGEPAVRALDGHIVVLFNGAQAANGAYAVIDLAGQVTTPQGLFVIGNAAVPNVDLVIPDSSIQNGTDAVAVYRAASGSFPISPPTGPSPDRLVDAVIYDTGDPTDDDLRLAFADPSGPGGPFLAQFSEGADNNPKSLARLPDAMNPFGAFTPQAPTPGVSNGGAGTPSGYDQWAATPNHAGIGGRDDDPDADGLTNLLEYALGSDPKRPAIPYTVSLNETGRLRLTLPKGAVAADDPKLIWSVDASVTLAAGSWSPADTTVVRSTPTEMVVDCSRPAPATFLRLRVTLLP